MPRDDRRYPKRPVLGIGALIFRRTKILLVQRGKEPLKGFWSLPGGALETGEWLEDGVCREVLEETGFVVEPVGVEAVFERIIPDAKGRAEYHYVLIDYACRIKSGDGKPDSDVSALAWVSERELPKYQLTDGTLPVILEAFEKRRRKK